MQIAGGQPERVLLLFLVGVLGFMIFCEALSTICGEVKVNPGNQVGLLVFFQAVCCSRIWTVSLLELIKEDLHTKYRRQVPCSGAISVIPRVTSEV